MKDILAILALFVCTNICLGVGQTVNIGVDYDSIYCDTVAGNSNWQILECNPWRQDPTGKRQAIKSM